MKKIPILLVFILFLLVVARVFADGKGPIRLEVPALLNVQRYHVLSLGQQGLMVFYESDEVNNERKRKWYFGLFDTLLQQKWLKYLGLTDKLTFVQARQKGNEILFLFQNNELVKSDYGFYELIHYTIAEQNFMKIAGTMPLKTEIAGFDFFGNTACLALNRIDKKADLLFINIKSGDVQPYHIENGENSRIEMLTYLKRKGFVVIAKLFRNKVFIQDKLLFFDKTGDKMKEITIENNNSHNIMRTYVPATNNDSILAFFGTYDLSTGKPFRFEDYKDNENPSTGGFFYLQLANQKQTKLKFYGFLDFSNISGTFLYRAYQMSKSKAKGGEKSIPVASLLYVGKPQLIKANNQYIITVEAYKPSYRTETRMDYDFYGRAFPYTYQVFDGYDFYDLILAGFSETGQYVWDNDFPLERIRTYKIEKHCLIQSDGNKMILAYIKGDKIVAQTIEGPADIGKRKEVKIAPKFVRDRVIQSDNSRIIHWYDNYYLVFGYQKLKNRTMKDQDYRTVFYLNKVAFE